MAEVGLEKDILESHRQIWQEKRILREIYTEWYQQIKSDLSVPESGKTVELGAGGGNFKQFMPNVISSDIDPCDWLDMVFDAHVMPFENNEIDNFVMIDVLHHLSNPVKFLEEVSRTLKRGGRLVMLEPYASPFSLLIYRKFHPEPFIFDVDYFKLNDIQEKHPWDSNQAIPQLIFYKHFDKFLEKFGSELKIVKKSRLSFLLYPASGGFENKSMIPNWSIPFFKVLEKLLSPFSSILAFRCYIALEKI